MATIVRLDTLGGRGQPSKKSKKSGRKGSVSLHTIGSRDPRYRASADLFCMEKLKIGDHMAPSHSPRAHGTTKKIGK